LSNPPVFIFVVLKNHNPMKRKLTPKGWFPHLYFLLSFLVMAAAGLSLSLAPNRVFTPQISVSAFEPFCSTGDSLCLGFADIPFSVSVDCGQEVPQLTATVDGQPVPNAISGAYPDYVFSGSFAVGIHELVLQVADSCGQTAAEMLSFEVVDCQAPQVVWASGISIEFSPVDPPQDIDGNGYPDYTGHWLIAEDLVVQAGGDCTPPLRYSVHLPWDNEAPDPNQSEIWLHCSNTYTENIYVDLYAWDNADNPYSLQPDGTLGGPNYVHAHAYVLLQNMFIHCGSWWPPHQADFSNFTGIIETIDGLPQDSVVVTVSGGSNLIQLTNQNGQFTSVVIPNYTYTISPFYDNMPTNGVTTADLVLINKHILGVQLIADPYKLIAADANSSKAITVQDIIALRRLILHVDSDFNNNTSWRFVPKIYVFPDPANPWAEVFPEMYTINNVSPGNYEVDFIAIKIGDVNGSAQ